MQCRKGKWKIENGEKERDVRQWKKEMKIILMLISQIQERKMENRKWGERTRCKAVEKRNENYSYVNISNTGKENGK